MIESVDPGGSYIDQAYSPAGLPALAYASGDLLRFAWHDGSSWAAETVSKGTGTTGISLAYGPAGAAMSFRGAGKGAGIKYASRGPLGWSSETVESGTQGEFTSLAFDAGGNPAIAYLKTNRKTWDLVYARKVGGTWVKQVVDTGSFRYVALAFDRTGYPAIAYAASEPGSTSLSILRYARWNGSAWLRETVLSGTVGYGVFCDLAFDPVGGGAAIVHTGSSTSGGLLTRQSGRGWTTEPIDDCFDYCGRHPRLAFAAGGSLWIGSIAWGNTAGTDRIRAAGFDGSAWVRELVETTSSNWASVGIAPGGQPTIGYNGIRFARRIP
jgi:hypothetical protein